MKKLLFETILLVLAISVPIPAIAQVSVHIGIPLPPPIVISAPPEVILLPHTGVYVAPDLAVVSLLFRWLVVAFLGRAVVPLTRTIAQVGDTIMVFRLFMEEYLQDGEMTTGHIVGMGMNFIISVYLIRNFNRFGKGISVNNLSRNIEWDHSMPGRRGIQADRPQPQGRTLQRDVGRSQQGRPIQQRPGPQQSGPPHGGPGERR